MVYSPTRIQFALRALACSPFGKYIMITAGIKGDFVTRRWCGICHNLGFRGLFPFWAQIWRFPCETFGPSAPEEGRNQRKWARRAWRGQCRLGAKHPICLALTCMGSWTKQNSNTKPKSSAHAPVRQLWSLKKKKSTNADSCVNLICHARPSLFYYIHSAF